MSLCDNCMNFPCTDGMSVMLKSCPAFCPILKPQTNADRIRAMSDEKLATWLGDMLGVYPFGTDQWDRQAWLDWLKKEVEE